MSVRLCRAVQVTIALSLIVTFGCVRAMIPYRPDAPDTLMGEWTGTWTAPVYPGWNGTLAITIESVTKSKSNEEWLVHGRIESK